MVMATVRRFPNPAVNTGTTKKKLRNECPVPVVL